MKANWVLSGPQYGGVLGGALVYASLGFTQPALEVWILLLAPTVLVPLALKLVPTDKWQPTERRCLTAFNWLQLPSAALLVGGFAMGSQGILPAMLSFPWVVATLLLAVVGFLRLRRNGLRLNSDSATAAACLLLPVGAGWGVVSRAGWQPQDFSHAIVLLTAVHFHYAGFVLPLLAGRADGGDTSWSTRLMLAAIIVGVPAVGVGISLSPTVEVVAAISLALACLALAARQTRMAFSLRSTNATLLLLVSSTSIVAAMLLAGVYAVGEFMNQPWLAIPTMIQTHGVLNAFGFALCGILAHLANDRSAARLLAASRAAR